MKCFTWKSVLRLSTKNKTKTLPGLIFHYLMQWWINVWQLLTFWGQFMCVPVSSDIWQQGRSRVQSDTLQRLRRVVHLNIKKWAAGQYRQEPHCLHGGAGEPIYQYVMTYRRVLSGLWQTPCQMLISLFSASLLLSLTGCSSHSVGREFLAKGKESWLKVSVCSRDTTAVWIPYCSLWHPFLFPLQ